MIVQKFIADSAENERMKIAPIVLNFSARTESLSTQLTIEGKLHKKKKGVFGA